MATPFASEPVGLRAGERSALRRIWRVALQTRPRSADRTQSQAVVSQKREFFGMRPETFGNFAAPLAKLGGWRPCTKLEKPAIGGHFSDY
jgi:hypothetical protein